MNDPSSVRLPCMCASLRRVSRAITQCYEEVFRKLGMRASQFTVLQMLEFAGELNQGQISRLLAIDSTTLTRTLGLMSRRGWIRKHHGSDRREWRFRLTARGKSKLRQALPLWEQVQKKLREQLGQTRWDSLHQLADEMTSALTE